MFQCRLNKEPWVGCVSPFVYSDLPDGHHRFKVRARGPEGAWAPGFATRYWLIQSGMAIPTQEQSYLATRLISSPPAVSESTDAEFQFEAEGAADFRCKLGKGSWAACSSPMTFNDLSSGQQVFRLQARRLGQKWERGHTIYRWTITERQQQPVIALIETPSPVTEQNSATFVFSADQDVALQCRLNQGHWGQCESPAVFDELPVGHHQFRVRTSHADGYWGRAVASYGWEVVEQTTAISCPEGVNRWSQAESWGGAVPVEGEDVVIPAGTQIALDTNTPPLGSLSINGSLEFCRQDLALTSDWIMLHGELRIGSEAEPFEQNATITLTGDNPEESVMDMGTRGIMVMGGRLELHGQPPETRFARINQHAEAGTNQLVMELAPDWQIGDEIVIAPTDYYGVGHTEAFTIAAIEGNQITLSDPLAVARWGRLQYLTSQGMALTPDASVVFPHEDMPTVLDERAVVGNLTRNIVIQAPDDALWQEEGFGAHLMIMNLSSEIHVQGVEFSRVGQAGRLGRYPWHWHILSYAADGSELGDAQGHYFRNNSVHDSANRCVTIHATNGIVVEGNVCYNISGHGIFFEDGTERRNRVENNLVLRNRGVPVELSIKSNEVNAGGRPLPQGGGGRGSSGIWATNPDNIVRGNHMADADGFGLWLAFPNAPVGATKNVPIVPSRLAFGNFDNNIMHSNRLEGVNFDFAEIDDEGTVRGGRYVSTTDGALRYNQHTILDFEINGLQIWKNRLGAIWSRSVQPHFHGFTVADNEDIAFDGQGIEGEISRSLLIGTSLNHPTPRPNPEAYAPTAFATYHSQFDIHHNVVMEYPLVPGEISGMFNTDDYYLRAVDKGQRRNNDNLLIRSHGGYRVPHTAPYFSLAGAVWDPHGIWGAEGNYFVYDEPFFTHNADCDTVAPGTEAVGGVSCSGEYYGIDNFLFNSINAQDLMAIRVTRFDEQFPDQVIDVFEVGSAPGENFDHMRDFAARENGIFLLEFPESELQSDVAIDVNNMSQDSDRFVLGIQFDGTEPAQVFASTFFSRYLREDYALQADDDFKRTYTALDSRQAVIESDGGTYYQDVENNIVWVHLVGGMNPRFDPENEDPNSNQRLYYEWHLKVW